MITKKLTKNNMFNKNTQQEPTPEDWAKWYQHKSNKEIEIETYEE